MSEDMISGLISKSKEFVKARNIAECRMIVANYIERITVFQKRVEIRFKINVPDEDNNTLAPLEIEESRDAIKNEYMKVI
jgi:hypothetical protein